MVAKQVAREGFSGEMWVCLNLNEVVKNNLYRSSFTNDLHGRGKMILQERKRIKMETIKQRRLNYEKIKTAKDCTEKKEIINS